MPVDIDLERGLLVPGDELLIIRQTHDYKPSPPGVVFSYRHLGKARHQRFLPFSQQDDRWPM